MSKSIKVARIATVPFFLDHQLCQQMEHLIAEGFDVSAIASSAGDWSKLENANKLQCVKLDIAREPAPIRDLVSLFKLYRLFKVQKFDIIHSTTPKAGLLCALAGWLAGTKCRLHTFTGQTWAIKKGIGRWGLRFLDKVIVRLNTQCYVDSESQREFIIYEGVGNRKSLKVIGKGSLAGVDLERFSSRKWLEDKKSLYHEFGLSEDDFVIIFVGRLSREKGIFELVEAFQSLKQKYSDLHLLLVGPCEEILVEEELKRWTLLSGLHYVGATNTPEKYLSISHFLCLPSYREGFGTVVIEAAAMGLPSVGTKIIGLCDAIEDGVTGVLAEPEDTLALQASLAELIENRDACKILGLQAYQRCRQHFDAIHIGNLLVKEYIAFLNDLDLGL